MNILNNEHYYLDTYFERCWLVRYVNTFTSCLKMADCVQEITAFHLKNRVIWLYLSSYGLNMNRTICLFLIAVFLCSLCLLVIIMLSILPVSTKWLLSSYTGYSYTFSFTSTSENKQANHKHEDYKQKMQDGQTSIMLRVRQKIPIDPGKFEWMNEVVTCIPPRGSTSLGENTRNVSISDNKWGF